MWRGNKGFIPDVNKRFLHLQELADLPLFNATCTAEMWDLAYSLAGKTLTKELKKKGLYLPPDELYDAQINIAEKLMVRIRKGHKVKKSVLVCVRNVMQNVLYHPRKIDKATIFVEPDIATALQRKYKVEE